MIHRITTGSVLFFLLTLNTQEVTVTGAETGHFTVEKMRFPKKGERDAITTHKESSITNNPNDWAKEVGNPRYILDLLLSVINVSVRTVDIVAGLPELNFE